MKGTSTMGSLKALILASVALTGLATVVKAADLLPPPPMVEPMAPAPVEFGGWYLRGDVGVGIPQVSGSNSTFYGPGTVPGFGENSHELDSHAFIGAGVGYQINNWFRADVTGEYRASSRYSGLEHYANVFGTPPACGIGQPYCYDGYSGSVTSGVFLANGYVDLGTWSGLKPYLGVGIGGSYNKMSNLTDYGLGFGTAPDNGKFSLAWALMAGIGYQITPNLTLELGYRYLNMGNVQSGIIQCYNTASCGPGEQLNFKLASQDIRIGMRWMFADVAPPPPQFQAPLVRKY
jgi:opacity protein-like surface antigen